MLPVTHRMRRASDFTAAVRSGRRAGRPSLVVHGTRDQSGSAAARPAIVGFVVSRAVGNAVARNTVKRRLRHLVSARLDRLPEGARLVVRANPVAAGMTSAALGADLDAALSRLLPKLPDERSGVSR